MNYMPLNCGRIDAQVSLFRIIRIFRNRNPPELRNFKMHSNFACVAHSRHHQQQQQQRHAMNSNHKSPIRIIYAMLLH